MPRPSRLRSVEGEANLARRIQRERTYRGMSYETLAKAMTDAGCKTQGSALFRVEKGDPPRRITVDELIALATVFDVSVENLLTPVEVLRTQRGQELLKQIEQGTTDLGEVSVRLLNAFIEYFELAAYEPDMREYIDGHLFPAEVAKETAERLPLLSVVVDGEDVGDRLDDATYRTGFQSFFHSIIEQASSLAEAAVVKDNRRDGSGPLGDEEKS